MIATGGLETSVFAATEILARHDGQYSPREVTDALKELGIFHPEPAASRSGG